MDVAGRQEIAADRLSRAAFKEDVVRDDNRRATVDLQHALDVLKAVQLLVAGRRDEVLAGDGERFAVLLALLVDDQHVGLLAERRICQDDVVAGASGRLQAVANRDRWLALLALERSDAMQQQVHCGEARNPGDKLRPVQGIEPQVTPLVTIQFVVVHNEPVGREQEASRAGGRIEDQFARIRWHAIDDRVDQRARREVLSRAALGVLRVLLQQSLIGVALDVGIEREPPLPVDQVADQAGQLGGVLDLVLRLLEDDAKHRFRILAKRLKDVPVVRLQRRTFEPDETVPVQPCGNERVLVVGRLGALVGHLEEEQVGELLDVVAVGEPVVAEQIAVVPELLDDLLAMRARHCLVFPFCCENHRMRS